MTIMNFSAGLKAAAEQGIAVAQYYLGICYYNGEGVKQDFNEAFRWYKSAAEQGNADAQCRLGNCYKNGEGVQQDYNEAFRWYKAAAEQGNRTIMRPSAGIKLPLNREMQKLNAGWEIVIIMEKE